MTQAGPATALYLDMVGGISGDMFLAAAVDLEPGLERKCMDTLARIHGLPASVEVRFVDQRPSGGFGRSFGVTERADTGDHHQGRHHHHHHADAPHGVGAHDHYPDSHGHRIPHVGFEEALEHVRRSGLDSRVQARAIDIFTHLAEGEGAAHGVEPGDVHFHEVGGWDSIIDILLAAAVIESLGEVTWLCGPVPLGRGTIEFSHGELPVPAPATTEILRGFSVFQDQFVGERVTPTGAAILKHLAPEQLQGVPIARLLGCGTGYGSRTIPGLSNALRIFRLECDDASGGDRASQRVAIVEFEVDDQSPEDLAIGLEALRDQAGVLDVTQTPAYGKKGRLAMRVQVLAEPAERESVVRACLSVTSSIGVRWTVANRSTLQRRTETVQLDGTVARVKLVTRPDGEVTGKVEAEDLEAAGRSFAERERLRRRARRSMEGDSGGLE